MASEYENKIEVGTVVYEWCGNQATRNGVVTSDTRWNRKLTVTKVALTQFTTDDGRRWLYRRDYRDASGYQCFGKSGYVHLEALEDRPTKTWDEHTAEIAAAAAAEMRARIGTYGIRKLTHLLIAEKPSGGYSLTRDFERMRKALPSESLTEYVEQLEELIGALVDDIGDMQASARNAAERVLEVQRQAFNFNSALRDLEFVKASAEANEEAQS